MFNKTDKTEIKRFINYFVIPEDKANHLIYGLLIYFLASLLYPSLALLIVIIIALLKEVYDNYGNGTSDWKDFMFTITLPLLIEIIRSY
jgi:hypothetical protein